MSENKLIEKTRKVLKTQKELSEVIDELKSEVKKVYYENEELAEENELLRKKLAFFDEEKEPLHKQEKVIEQKIEVEPVEKEVIEEKRDSPIDSYKRSVKEVAPKRSNALIEFFLGKNVIAKIAIVLIFLGVISFGQIAYLEWLDDVGRVLLIMFGGFVFGGIAYYTEKKDIIVFSSVFYGLSVFTIYYSLVLGKFGFELYSNSILSYSLIVLMVGVLLCMSCITHAATVDFIGQSGNGEVGAITTAANWDGAAVPYEPDIGLIAVEAAKKVRDEFKDKIDFKIGTQPIFGFSDLSKKPERWEIFEKASEFADVVGGLPEKDDASDKIGFDKHLRLILELGSELKKEVHVHVDQGNDPGESQTEILVEAKVCILPEETSQIRK